MRLVRVLLLLLLPACRCTTTTDADGNKVTHLTLDGVEPTRRDSFVDAPTTLEALRKRSKPSDVVAEVRTVTVDWDNMSTGTDEAKVANCGHAGIACALVLLLPRG